MSDRRDRVLAIVAQLRECGITLRAVAPIINEVDPTVCGECGRTLATDADWKSGEIEEGDRDDLCWGSGANCETDYSEEES